jgi:hypothetical protein
VLRRGRDRRPDHWETRAYVFATVTDRNPPGATTHPTARTTWSGYYVDSVARVSGTWLFLERNIAPWSRERAARRR